MSNRSWSSRKLCALVVATSLWLGQGCGGLEGTDGSVLEDGDADTPGVAEPSPDNQPSPDNEPFLTAARMPTLPKDHCLAGITDFDKPGPFTYKFTVKGLVEMYVPDVPKGCKVPMVHLSNGTGAICEVYRPSLVRLASHGFLALCFQSPITGSGDLGILAFERALKEYPDLADHRFGSTGHSQGGFASFITLQYAEAKWGDKGIYAGLAMQPATGFGAQPLAAPFPLIYQKIKSPVFMFSGVVTDGLVPEPWVWLAFFLLSPKVEAYDWAKLSLHIPVPNLAEMQVAIPWFRWKLLGDQRACEAFKALPKKDPTWRVRLVKNEQPCD